MPPDGKQKIKPIKGPWMLKGERDLRDRGLKCMVRGVLMAEFREKGACDPTALLQFAHVCLSVQVLLLCCKVYAHKSLAPHV